MSNKELEHKLTLLWKLKDKYPNCMNCKRAYIYRNNITVGCKLKNEKIYFTFSKNKIKITKRKRINNCTCERFIFGD